MLPMIAEAKSHIEALKIMGRQNQGNIVNMTKAADTMIRSGRAKGKRRNLVITIYNHFRENDEWKWVSPGNFKFVGK